MIFPFWRVTVLVAAVCFIGLGGLCVFVAGVHEEYFWGCINARPVDMAVDFSVAGEYAVEFENVYGDVQGGQVRLRLPGDWLAEHDAEKLLGELGFVCEVRDAGGNVVSFREGPCRVMFCEPDDEVCLCFCQGLERGDYEFSFVVRDGVEELTGVEQRLVMRCQIDGSALRSAYFARRWGRVCFWVGGGFLGLVVLITFWKRWRSRGVGLEVDG